MFDSPAQANAAIELAIGRILRMGSRPTQKGDIEMYEKCRRIVFLANDYLELQQNLNRFKCK